MTSASRSRKRGRTPGRTSIASLAIAALGAGALAFNGIGGPPVSDAGPAPGSGSTVLAHNAGFTLARNADGAITFTINDVVDTQAATVALNDAGITGRVVEVGADPDCPTKSSSINPTDTYPDDHNGRAFGQGPSSVTFRSSDYPPGGGLFLVLIDFEREEPPGDRRAVDPVIAPVVFILAFDDASKIPTCINADVDQ